MSADEFYVGWADPPPGQRRFSARLSVALLVERPGGGHSAWLLVGLGKFGAVDRVKGLDGRRVRGTGTLIHRDEATMLELTADPLEDLGPAAALLEVEELGEQTLFGEIVDSKCFFGVMNPGNLKAHRACAIRCISGGIPPVLLVRDAEGHARHVLLVGGEGEAVNEAVLDWVAEPVSVRGRLQRHGERFVLRADPASLRRDERPARGAP